MKFHYVLVLVLLSGCAQTSTQLIETMKDAGCQLQSYSENEKQQSRTVTCK